MNGIVCQVCKEPVWNSLCSECIAENIVQWLPQELISEFRGFHNQISNNFINKTPDLRGRHNCLSCKNAMRASMCPYCYTNEIYHWLLDKDPKLAERFVKVFNFDFEDSGYKEFQDLEGIHPLIGDSEEGMDMGICEECECFSSELRESNGKWVCEDCTEDE